MFRQGIAAAAVAAILLAQAPSMALANPDKGQSQQRDGHSRYEVGPYNYLPLVFASHERLRVAMIVLMMQHLTYQMLMAPGVEATSQNRVGLGGLFGGVFGQTYSAQDFVKSLEIGTVYRAGDDTIAVALKDDLKLEDYKVIVFNGDNQYDLRDRPALRQIDPQVLKQLGVVSMAAALLHHTLDPQGVALMAALTPDSAGDGELTPIQAEDLPVLRRLQIGKVYAGGNNTLLVVIPPTIVLDR